MTVEQAARLTIELHRIYLWMRDQGMSEKADTIAAAINYISDNETRLDDARDALRNLMGKKDVA